MSIAQRLTEFVAAANGSPVDVSIGRIGQSATVQLRPDTTAGREALAAFDWSEEAHAAWLEDQQPERKGLRQAASQAIADNEAFLANNSPNNAMVLSQVRA